MVPTPTMPARNWSFSPEQLKSFREAVRCTFREFADRMNEQLPKRERVAPASVLRWERGEAHPKTVHLTAISDAFNVDFDLFWTRRPAKNQVLETAPAKGKKRQAK